MVFHYLNHNTVDTISGIVPAAVVTTAQITEQPVPDGLVWLSYAAAISTLLLNIPKIFKSFMEMFGKKCDKHEDKDED
jgi:hypothetical protein